MEDSVHLVCESLGVREDDEVNVEKVCGLYQKIFLTSANLDDTQRAITQVSVQNAGLPCSGRMVLHVLLVMEKERESREQLYWELQILKSGRISTSAEMKSQPLTHNSVCKDQKKQETKQWNMMSLLGKAKRLYMRLHLDGVRSVLPSLSYGHIAVRPFGWMSPTTSDILQLLQYKYDIIKERLYREMLQEERGTAWCESEASQEQLDCVCELGEAAEQAFKQMDFLYMCELPGALRCYRSGCQLILQGCEEAVKPRDQAWSSKPREQAWSAAVFHSELESHHQEERDSLTVLYNRAERAVQIEIYLSVCVAVKRAERETHSHIALLASRQYWDKWPYTRGPLSQELIKFWLQEKPPSPTKKFQQDWRAAGCTLQQAVLQYLVLCQEQERQSLMETLHTLSLNELQDQSHTLPPAYKAEIFAASLRQCCVFSLREIKASRMGVSWSDCAIQLLTQLTLAHDDETWTVLHSLAVMDACGATALLCKYESELHFPKLHNLYELLQPPASRGMGTANAVTLTDGERTDQRQNDSTENETQTHCSGCGVILTPEDAPYLEILGARDQRGEENTEMSEGEEERRREESERETEGTEERRELGKEEERVDVEEKREEERWESEGAEARAVEISVEKQGSLITLAWSNPSDAEMSAVLPEVTAEISTDSHTQISSQPVHGDPLMVHNELHSQTHPEDIGSPLSQQNEQEHPVQRTVEEHLLVKAIQEQSSSSMCESSKADGHLDSQHPPASQQDPEDTHAAAQVHTSTSIGMEAACEGKENELVCHSEKKCEEVCVNVCEEQQLQREATMRSLVHIQRRAEKRWQRDRDRQLLRVQERLAIIQNRKSDEDLLGLTQEDTFRHLTSTVQQEDEQHQKNLVREKLQQLRRERSYILQSRRERNTAGFKELLGPTTQHMTNTEDGL